MILVTGAGGLSGSIVVREFARRDVPIKALVRNRRKASALEGLPGVELFEGDMLQPQTLGPALERVERVLMISSSDERMVDTQCTFIDSCRKAGIRHIVKFSGKESSIGFDSSRFRFVQMHEEVEHYLERSSIGWTHLRPSQFMQVYFREVPTIVTRSALLLPMDNSKLAPVDIEDIAKVALAVLTSEGHDGKSYEMTGPEALNMVEVAERISEAVGKTVRYINVDPKEKRQALLAAGVPGLRADALDELFAERRRCPESRIFLGTHEKFGILPTTFLQFARWNARIFRGEVDTPSVLSPPNGKH